MVPGVIGYIPEYRGVTGGPRRLLGLMGPSGGRGEATKGQPRAPPPQVRIGQGGGGGGAPSFPPSLPLLPSPFLLLVGLGKGESYSY